MPTLEIITIGTELLLGEIQDTNSTYIARTLRDHGIDIYRITTIGDNAGRISSAIKEALTRAEIIITTGGLGPTVDDPTREAVAMATDRELEYREDLWEVIQDRFKLYGRKPTENNRRQAYIPKGSLPIENPVGTAPCYVVEMGEACVVSLPGVPSEMKTILHESIIPFLHQKFELKTRIIKATVLHAASIGESAIDELIGDLEEYANPTVGLLAHPGQVDVRVTAKACSEEEAAALSKPVVQELLDRLGNNIYGQDQETLQGVINGMLNEKDLSLGVVEYGLDGTLIEQIQSEHPRNFKSFILDDQPEDIDLFENQVAEYAKQLDVDACLGAALIVDTHVTLYIVYIQGESHDNITRHYGGPKDHAPLWSRNASLDYLRRKIQLAQK
ncbi:MAG: competence/damage-inducible protein A [Anaerolineaceae bacterium]|nr:competence/damage-inducible protein A [Anaerolineaceae bacterium]